MRHTHSTQVSRFLAGARAMVPALAFAITPALAPAAPAPELPVEVFFQAPTMSRMSFSPDGTKVLYIVPHKGRQNLAVVDLVKGTKNLLSDFNDRDAQSPFWASNERIFFLVDDAGKEEPSLYAVNADGTNPSILARDNTRPLRRIDGDNRHILALSNATYSDWPDVVRMNIRTGEVRRQPVARAPGPVQYYVLDRDDNVRIAVLADDTTKLNRVLHRKAEKGDWEEILSFPFDAPGWRPIAFDGDNRTLFVASNIGRKTLAIFRYDTETRFMEGSPVFADDTYDVEEVIYDRFKQKVVGIRYEAERLRFHWLDEEMQAIHARMEKALPNTVHNPVQFSEDGSRILFGSYSDRDPGVYYIYDRARQKLSELAVIKPDIDPDVMAPMKPITYTARDGLSIHGYLTLPVGRDPKNLPLIVNPHGGPYGPRDTWGFNAEVQFLANRGFAVLQMNFRGSGGYGYWFEELGFKKWGLEMQDDISDGVKWAINQGIADPARVVISGASYGGYATMAGLVYTPELYCAGINYIGVVDIQDVIPRDRAARRLHWFHTRIGDLNSGADRKRLYDTSPVNFAERIRVPLLMAYGRNDPRVKISHAYDIERALNRARKPYKLIIEDDEGHGFADERKRLAFYREVDAFLKEHVLGAGPRSEVIIKPSEVLEMPVRSGDEN